MAAKKKKRGKRQKDLFDSIRKPTAPPVRKFEERPHGSEALSLRKAKHKKKLIEQNESFPEDQ